MSRKDLKHQVYTTLREKIINCEYPPGSLLNEAQLSIELGVSRTPIREALNRIEHEGFIKILPKKGILVTEVSLNDVLHIFGARLEIEPIALRMAGPYLAEEKLLEFKSKFMGDESDISTAFRLDTAMHLFIIDHCGNRFIIDMMHRLFDENTRVIISSSQNKVKIHDARREHIEILDLLLEKDYEKAQRAMRYHVECCKKAALDYFYNFHTYPTPDATYQSHW
ncbi:MAG: GntR family transcriptional regulator [Oscillospiraceae bacterium]|jgi:DNA-binding GntR family transcriptional regulator